MMRILDFHEEMDRFQNNIPRWVGRNLNRLRGKRAIWVRVPTGVALVGGGVLGFLPLPIVGIWMLPVGLALLAHDIPTMRGQWLVSCISLIARSSNGKVVGLIPTSRSCLCWLYQNRGADCGGAQWFYHGESFGYRTL
jgi:hypothetical protein